MSLKYFFSCFVILLLGNSINTTAQVIDNTSTFKTLPAKSYFRFQYDNDYFTKADEYYSQGISFEYVHPGLKRFPLTKLLLKSKNSDPVFGIGLNIFGYTPTSILSDSILYGDRPYSGEITLKTFSSATDTIYKRRISSAINIGIIGPAALGNEIQTNIHKWTGNPVPLGWYTQIRNDIILNYQVDYEKQLLAAKGHFLLNGVGAFRLGTLEDRISGGINFMMGNFNDPYASRINHKKKVEYYLYGQARTHFIGYDASLQGGLFNRHSPYIISAGDIERATFQADYGIVVNFRKLYLSYSQSFLTKEFSTGKNHRWGGINIGFSL
ncbi:MAG: lipid A deacylase LpxR family protein [Ferruginibacter sp.]